MGCVAVKAPLVIPNCSVFCYTTNGPKIWNQKFYFSAGHSFRGLFVFVSRHLLQDQVNKWCVCGDSLNLLDFKWGCCCCCLSVTLQSTRAWLNNFVALCSCTESAIFFPSADLADQLRLSRTPTAKSSRSKLPHFHATAIRTRPTTNQPREILKKKKSEARLLRGGSAIPRKGEVGKS